MCLKRDPHQNDEQLQEEELSMRPEVEVASIS